LVAVQPGIASTVAREAGFEDAMKKEFPDIRIVDKRYGMTDFAKSLQVAENMLTANPDLDGITGNKPRLIILNRTDQADPAATKLWSSYFKTKGVSVLETDAKTGKGTAAFTEAVRTLLKEKLRAYEAKGQAGRVLRVMIVGIPNVGKSSFINRIAGRKAAEAASTPASSARTASDGSFVISSCPCRAGTMC
jgi:GTPase Era involved in 16S rRNA processing